MKTKTFFMPGIVLTILLILSACGGGAATASPTPAAEITFSADRTSLQPGECTLLHWQASAGFVAWLDGQEVPRLGEQQVCPQQTHAYELKVDMGTHVETRTVEISVSSAAASPGPGPVAPGVPAYQAEAWLRLGGPPGGLGYDIRYDFSNFDRWYVTDAFAGFFISTDRGLTWSEGNQGLPPWGEKGDFIIPVFSATVDPHNPAIVWIGLDHLGHIYKSTDHAQTWVQMDNGVTPNNGLSFRGFTVDPRSSDIVYAAAEVSAEVFIQEGKKPQGTIGSGGRVYRTTDGGRNWTMIWEGDSLARYIWIAPDDPNRIYVSTGIFDREPLHDPAHPAPDDRAGIGILRSTDGGATWTILGRQNGLNCLRVGSLYMKPDDSMTLLAGPTVKGARCEGSGDPEGPQGGVYLTTDGGDHWQEVIPDQDIGAVEYCQQNPSIAYAAGGEAVFRSEDGGLTWQRFGDEQRHTWGPPGLAPGMPIDMQTDPENCDRLFINNYVGGNFLSEDGGRTWRSASRGYAGSDPPRIFVDPLDPAHVWSVTRMAPWESTDGGLTWTGMAFSELVIGGEAMGMDPGDARHLIIDSGAALYETRDGGQTWSKRLPIACPADLTEHDCVGTMFIEIVFAPSDPRIVYAGSRNTSLMLDIFETNRLRGVGIAKSTDGGQTWSYLTDPTIARLGIVAIAVHPTDPQTLYAGGSAGFGVFKSTDGGQSWSSVNQGLPQPVGTVRALAIDPADPNHIFMGGDQGLFVSTNGGDSWTQVTAGLDANAGIVNAVIFDEAHPGVVYAATLAGVVYSTDGGQTFLPLTQGLNGKVLVASDLALSADGSVLYATGIGVFRLGTP